jgi:hypothetical protein
MKVRHFKMAKTLAANYESGVKGARAGKRLAPRRTVPGSQDPENGPESVIKDSKAGRRATRCRREQANQLPSTPTVVSAMRELPMPGSPEISTTHPSAAFACSQRRIKQRCLLFTTDERRRRGA